MIRHEIISKISMYIQRLNNLQLLIMKYESFTQLLLFWKGCDVLYYHCAVCHYKIWEEEGVEGGSEMWTSGFITSTG